nr:PREDICTED: sentrin-specific protease 1-like [Bemisia tabaci]
MECPPESIARFLLNQWIDDVLINHYGYLLQERDLSNENLKIKLADTFFFEASQRDGAEIASKFLKDTHLRSTDLTLVPCNVHYNHWALSVVDLKNHVIIVFDSRYCDEDAQYILECMLGFITTCFPNTFEIDHWNCYAGVCPQQNNTVDCGPLMLMCMEAVSRRAQIVLPDRLELGSSLRIEIKNQVFDNKVAHLSEGQLISIGPLAFSGPPETNLLS